MYSDFSHMLPGQLGGCMLGTESDLSEYIYFYTPYSDNTPSFGVIVCVTYRLSAVSVSKLLVLQENKSITPKLFS